MSVLASPFEDGTEMAVADLLYPYAFAYRWGAKAGPATTLMSLAWRPLFAAMEERLVGLKLVRVDKTTHAVAEGLNVVVDDAGAGGLSQRRSRRREASRGARPAVEHGALASAGADGGSGGRGYAAFSQEEAARRQVPWLDLVRDPALAAQARRT